MLGSKGIVNASVRLQDASGRLLARRDLDEQCVGWLLRPSSAEMSVRQPGEGECKVTVRYADGLERVAEVDLQAKPHSVVVVDRGEVGPDDEF